MANGNVETVDEIDQVTDEYDFYSIMKDVIAKAYEFIKEKNTNPRLGRSMGSTHIRSFADGLR